MKKRRLKKSVIYASYVLVFLGVFGSIYFIEKSIEPENTFNKNGDYNYVSKTVFENTIPVNIETPEIIRPYLATDIMIVKNYYDYKSDSANQEKSLLYYENTYLQSSGVSYSGSNNFDVVSILDGTVVSVKEDNILGNTVQIRHNNDTISVYQSLSEIKVKENQIVKQGEVIAKSGTSNISKELGDHLHFELIVKGQNVNPEEYYNKKISEI